VGLVIARALRRLRLLDAVTVIEHRGEGASLLDIWRDTQAVILVDAAAAGVPGMVMRFDAAWGPLPVTLHTYSSHGIGAGEIIELARALGELPPVFVVYAIAGRRYTTGTRLSPEVKAAARKVIAEIRTFRRTISWSGAGL
jgi:hydrogenase maturation protease